jgi:hypothetical protein
MKETKTNSLQRKKKAILKALENHYGNVTLACKDAKVDRTMFYDYIKADEEFAKDVAMVKEVKKDFAENALVKNMKEGKEASIMFYLKTQCKDRGYIERSEVVSEAHVTQANYDISRDEALDILDSLHERLSNNTKKS